MADDWATRIRDARLVGVDLMAQMSEADWAEYRAECRATRGAAQSTVDGGAHQGRRLASVERQRAASDQQAS